MNLRHLLRQPSPSAIRTVTVTRDIPAPIEDVWHVMTDPDVYARLAPNLSRVAPFTPASDGSMQRRCWDVRNRHWDETVTSWVEGRGYAVRVHTDAPDYPYPLTGLTGSWTAAPLDGNRTRVTMRFQLTPRRGPAGSAFAAAMMAAAAPMARRILSGWDRLARERQAGYGVG